MNSTDIAAALVFGGSGGTSGSSHSLVEGYYYGSSFFYDAEHTEPIEPVKDMQYVDLTDRSQLALYFWDGVSYAGTTPSVPVITGSCVERTAGSEWWTDLSKSTVLSTLSVGWVAFLKIPVASTSSIYSVPCQKIGNDVVTMSVNGLSWKYTAEDTITLVT